VTLRQDGASVSRIISVEIRTEQDLVTGRQRARQLAALLGFSQQEQTRLATAVSEITRNAYQYAGGGRLDFSLDLGSREQFFSIEVSDHGSGIQDVEAVLSGGYVSSTGLGIGVAGTSRLTEQFQIESTPGSGTKVRFGKTLPAGAKRLEAADLAKLSGALMQQQTTGPAEELERQNRDLLQTLEALRVREAELEGKQEILARLNLELEETNRGVVALYAELDEKAAALQRADEMKSRFLSHISHEFRTPVNSVLALAQLLLNRVDGELTAEQEKQVHYIGDAAQHLAEMVNDLLDLAKVEAGKVEIRLAQADVNQFLGATRALMRPLANNDAVSLIFEDLPTSFEFETDESKLGQIVRNLISNALKFTQAGEVRVRAHVSETGDSVLFTVSDTGIGIAPADQERIFQEFAQVDNPIQKRVRGTGLGLPLSRRLAGLLGGTLSVQSEVGVGSTFTLTLPCQVWPKEGAEGGGDSREHKRRGSILIVDDEDTSRYLAHRLFEGTKRHLIDVTGFDAAERARFEGPALILLDLSMPGKSGFEVLEELRSDAATKDIPVVIHTSKVLTKADRSRLEGKIVAVLPKSAEDRLPALIAMRQVLDEPNLFNSEPEFSQQVDL
jgi:signal transduction histidine kinase/CheY-like chemotaxis protein